ncbi:MAG: ATP synthase subunit I [Xenococcaceae cyanobacterium MO_188.B32]|nr:ATP synthase subunit I [Xenococcaceae cyanobacterium MO_188.B32]
MSKTPLSWEQLLDFISSLQYLKRTYSQQLREISSWLLCLLGLVFVWIWNWKLLLATVTGIGFMVLVYWLQSKNWLDLWSRWQHFLSNSNRQLIVAVSSGSITALGIYIAACIWTESENQWLAMGIILQTFASLITLALLVWHLWSNNRLRQNETELNRLLADLTHKDSLRKIIAIRQLTRLFKNGNLPQDYNVQLVEYYCLMLSQFQEIAVKEALLDSLESLGVEKFINKKNQPLQIPIQFKSFSESIYRSQ